MTSHRAILDLDQALDAPTRCPSCGGDLLPVVDGERGNVLCRSCRRCWHLELGWVSRVDPRACGHCARRGECVAVAGPSGS